MNREAYEEYKQEHPEELVGINRLMRYCESIEARKQESRRLKIAKIEMCRRLLNGEDSI